MPFGIPRARFFGAISGMIVGPRYCFGHLFSRGDWHGSTICNTKTKTPRVPITGIMTTGDWQTTIAKNDLYKQPGAPSGSRCKLQRRQRFSRSPGAGGKSLQGDLSRVWSAILTQLCWVPSLRRLCRHFWRALARSNSHWDYALYRFLWPAALDHVLRRCRNQPG